MQTDFDMPPSAAPSFLSRFLTTAFLCVAPLACAQGTTDTVYHLHGTVRDSVTGKPIGRALVTSIDRRLAAMTDSEGHFNIDLSVPGKADPGASAQPSMMMGGSARNLAITAQRPGYLVAEQQQAIVLDDSLNTTDYSIRLLPAAVVSGRVSANGVDSPQGVRVSLLRHSVVDGAFTWLPVGSHTVGSTGEFRFTNLQPGEYTVMTAEWTGGEPAATQRAEITQQYPPDFLGDTRTLATAGKFVLHYGTEQRAELHLRQATYYPIAVPVQNQPPNSPINVRVSGVDAMNGYQLGWNARDGAIEGSLPSGNYTLLLTSFGPQQGSASVPLTVANQPLEHAPVTLAAGSRIPIRVHTEFTQTSQDSGRTGTPGSSQANLAQVYLRPLEGDGSFGGSSVRHGEDGEPALENVQPGRYIVHGSSTRGYISSITSGSLDLLRHPLSIGDGGTADPIDVTLRDDGGTLTGSIDYGSSGGGTAAFTSLLLVPVDGAGDAMHGLARRDGKFTLQNIPPGSYRLFAVTGSRGVQLPYRDAQAMRALASKGTAVSIRAGQAATANATVTDLAEMDRE